MQSTIKEKEGKMGARREIQIIINDHIEDFQQEYGLTRLEATKLMRKVLNNMIMEQEIWDMADNLMQETIDERRG